MRRIYVCLWILAVGVGFVWPAQAADRRCFTGVPGISDCISGRFLEFWEANGGLDVFGYPLTPAFTEQTPEGVFLVQYFERQRFEYHPEFERPYDVLLGRLGAEIYADRYGPWEDGPTQNPSDGCLFFPETQHSLCEPFRSYWLANGLSDPDLDSFGRSLQLFGRPLTTPTQQRNPDGDLVLTQWFERARFEYHPRNPVPFKVLLGRLGAEIRQPPADPDGEITARISALLQAVNQERRRQGIGPLTLSEQLNQAAQAHSDDMAGQNFFSHTGSDGSDAGDRIERTGYQPRLWGENIAAGYPTAREVVQGWLESAGHRRIMLSPEYSEVGFGVAENRRADYAIYWTAVFADR